MFPRRKVDFDRGDVGLEDIFLSEKGFYFFDLTSEFSNIGIFKIAGSSLSGFLTGENALDDGDQFIGIEGFG